MHGSGSVRHPSRTVTAHGDHWRSHGGVRIHDDEGESVRQTRRRVLAGVGITAFAAGLVATAAPLGVPSAGAAGQTTLTFLNINDFHGRIDTNTTRFATTIETERAAAPGGADSVLVLSAGDNVGASLFASRIADDQPTIDVLNALELDASAVGNHEFDQGAADLFNDIIGAGPNADWPYLAANVYTAGTTTVPTPLQEYTVVTLNSGQIDEVRVGIIGAVTQETPSLVSPLGRRRARRSAIPSTRSTASPRSCPTGTPPTARPT